MAKRSSFPKPFGHIKQFGNLKPIGIPKPEIVPHVITLKEQGLISVLTNPIREKQLIRFWYEDSEKNFSDWRLVEPYLIGQTKFKAAKIMLVAYFLPSPSQRLQGHDQGWRIYNLDLLERLEVLPERYARRFEYKPKDSRMVKIFCATL